MTAIPLWAEGRFADDKMQNTARRVIRLAANPNYRVKDSDIGRPCKTVRTLDIR